MSKLFFESVSEQIRTTRLIVERFDENDFEFFKEITSDKLVKKYFSEYRKKFKPREYYDENILGCQDSGSLFLIIKTKEDQKPIGFINMFYECNGRWMVEYALIPSSRGNGYIFELLDTLFDNFTEMMITFKTNCYTVSELHLIIEQCNQASRSVISKLSNKRSCTLRIEENDIYLQV